MFGNLQQLINASGGASFSANPLRAIGTNWLILVGALLLFGILGIFLYYRYVIPTMKPKHNANREVANSAAGGNKRAELLFFYATWCPHCKSAKPIWDQLRSEYQNKTINGYKVIFTEVDCTEETAETERLMNQYNVEGYPTIKLLKDNQVIEYDAKPNKETLEKFLHTVLQ